MQSPADALGNAAMNLARHHRGVKCKAHILNGHILFDCHLPGRSVYFHFGKVHNKPRSIFLNCCAPLTNHRARPALLGLRSGSQRPKRNTAIRDTLHIHKSIPYLQVLNASLKMFSRNLKQSLPHYARRTGHSTRRAICSLATATRRTKWTAAGVALHNFNLIWRYTKHFRRHKYIATIGARHINRSHMHSHRAIRINPAHSRCRTHPARPAPHSNSHARKFPGIRFTATRPNAIVRPVQLLTAFPNSPLPQRVHPHPIQALPKADIGPRVPISARIPSLHRIGITKLKRINT